MKKQKSEVLLDAIGTIDSRLILGAEKKPLRKDKRFMTVSAIAAAFILTVCATFLLLPQNSSVKAKNLPILDVPEILSSGNGFEGYLAYDISDLVSGNPWNESVKIKTLPVYESPMQFDENLQPIGNDRETMLKALYDTFEKLGVDKNNVILKDDASEKNPDSVSATYEKIKVTVTWYLHISIEFEDGIDIGKDVSELPKDKQLEEAAKYLIEEYKDLLCQTEPTLSIDGGDYTFNGKRLFSARIYDANGYSAKEIANYNHNSVYFSCTEDGKLKNIFKNYEKPEKVGDYPIISLNEAKKALLRGEYLTNVPYSFGGEEYVKKVDLIYKTGEFGKYSMPYYRFYVEIPEEKHGELKTYGAFYVPAVHSQYLSGQWVAVEYESGYFEKILEEYNNGHYPWRNDSYHVAKDYLANLGIAGDLLKIRDSEEGFVFETTDKKLIEVHVICPFDELKIYFANKYRYLGDNSANEKVPDNVGTSIQTICAFITQTGESSVTLDVCEYLERDNSQRISELGLDELFDFPNGYYIHNPEKTAEVYTLTDETVYNFIDWQRQFIKFGDDLHYTASSIEQFKEYLATYKDSVAGMPFFIETDGKTVISISEKIMM